MHRIIALATCLLLSSASAAPYTINVTDSTVSSERRVMLENYFTQLYQPLGITPTFVYLPSKRGLEMVNNGALQAEAARFLQVGEKYPNLRQVKVPVTIAQSALFCLSQQHCKDTDDAAIGVLTGFVSAHAFCAQMRGACLFDDSPQFLVKLLEEGILTSLLLIKTEAPQVLCSLKSPTIYHSHQVQFDQPSFHWVHKDYEHFIAPLEASIQAFAQSSETASSNESWTIQLNQCGRVVHDITPSITKR